MTDSIQLNLRISGSLLEDIETVCKLLNISKTDWVRLTLAREAFEEKNRLLQEIKFRQAKKAMAKEFEQDVFQEIRSMENMMQTMLREHGKLIREIAKR
jgi:antitoxin component of RelBE/YafQ-DinJ toxin-antitoxin module